METVVIPIKIEAEYSINALKELQTRISEELKIQKEKGCKLLHMSHSISAITGHSIYGQRTIAVTRGYLATAILIFEK